MSRPPRWFGVLVFVLATLFFVATLDKWSHQWHLVTRDSQGREYWIDLRTLRSDGVKTQFLLLRKGDSSVQRRFEIDFAARRMVPLEGDRAPEVIAPGSVAEKLYLDLDARRR